MEVICHFKRWFIILFHCKNQLLRNWQLFVWQRGIQFTFGKRYHDDSQNGSSPQPYEILSLGNLVTLYFLKLYVTLLLGFILNLHIINEYWNWIYKSKIMRLIHPSFICPSRQKCSQTNFAKRTYYCSLLIINWFVSVGYYKYKL